MLFGIITVNSTQEAQARRNTKETKMKGWKVGPCTSLALMWELMEPISTCTHSNSAEWVHIPILTLRAMMQAYNLFFCLPRSQRETSDFPFVFVLYFFFSCFTSFHFAAFWVQFSVVSRWSFIALFFFIYIRQCFWSPPLACGFQLESVM